MIDYESIRQFLYDENAHALKQWNESLQLPIEQRLRKRKAIKEVTLMEESLEYSGGNMITFEVTFLHNISDFKEGDSLILHTGDTQTALPCTLCDFIDENTLLLEAYNRAVNLVLPLLIGKKLILDRGYVDLMQFVYRFFLDELHGVDRKLTKNFIATHTSPTLKNVKKVQKWLDAKLEQQGAYLLTQQRQAIINSLAAQNYFLIQGPPGTGKSFVLGLTILGEVLLHRHNVMVIGPNHAAINNALLQVVDYLTHEDAVIFKVGRSYQNVRHKIYDSQLGKGVINVEYLDVNDLEEAIEQCDVNYIVGTTPHALYTSRAKGLSCHTLIIDEAGQVTIPHAVMGIIKAKKVIFAGDHKQLPPIINACTEHPQLKHSVFQYLIDKENSIMLDTSFRMCRQICSFVSELFYDGILISNRPQHAQPIVDDNPIYDYSQPVVLCNVNSDGEQASEVEACAIAKMVQHFIDKGLAPNEIAILMPFRAQAAEVRRALRSQTNIDQQQIAQIVADTVDKMQGQEREVIIYSMTAGDADYIQEMADFLLNPNKLNVAFSRAKSKLIVVGSLQRITSMLGEQYPHLKRMMASENALYLENINL